MPSLGQTIPALPVRSIANAAAFYRDRLGFTVLHEDTGFAIVTRDSAEIHLWKPATVVEDTDYGTREFPALDCDGNLLSFYTRVAPRGPSRS